MPEIRAELSPGPGESTRGFSGPLFQVSDEMPQSYLLAWEVGSKVRSLGRREGFKRYMVVSTTGIQPIWGRYLGQTVIFTQV